MTDQSQRQLRLAVISTLVKRVPNGLGRTAMMKLTYFLETLRDVPLGYTFRLYTYGPYEAEVLEDLKVAESLGLIKSFVVHFSNGSGYQIMLGDQGDQFIKQSEDLLSPYEESLDWIVSSFGTRSAVDLEMASTIIFVDRENQTQGNEIQLEDIVSQVRDIKPRLRQETIKVEADSLKNQGLLLTGS